MSTLIDNPAGEWVSNEVYEIQVTDPCQGAGVGSAFGGLGTHNQPHQQLANRTAFLKQRQDTNIASIAALNVFAFSFIGSPAANGWLTLPVTITPGGGNAYPTIQWGFYSWYGLATRSVENGLFTVALNKAFATNFWWATAQLASNDNGSSGAGYGAMVNCSLELEIITPLPAVSAASFSVFADFGASGTLNIAGPGQLGLTGFYWLAIGD